MKRNSFALFVIILVTCTTAFAQVPAFSTDRPGQANGPLLIPNGALQIETGFQIEREHTTDISQTNYTYNNTLLKFGINENFELRFNAAYQGLRTSSDIATTAGLGPMAVGLKIKLADAHGIWPQAAIITHINLRSGAQEFKPSYTSNDVTLSCSHTLSERLSLTYNGGVKWSGDSPEATLCYAVSFGYQVTPKVGAFVESYAFFPEEHKPDHRVDGGFTYRLASLVQVDLSGGIGLTTNAPDYFISVGLSLRLFK